MLQQPTQTLTPDSQPAQEEKPETNLDLVKSEYSALFLESVNPNDIDPNFVLSPGTYCTHQGNTILSNSKGEYSISVHPNLPEILKKDGYTNSGKGNPLANRDRATMSGYLKNFLNKPNNVTEIARAERNTQAAKDALDAKYLVKH